MRSLIIIGEYSFKSQAECETFTRDCLNKIGLTNSVKQTNNEYFNYLLELCKRHPNKDVKLKNFVDFQINYSVLNKKGMELNIVNENGTLTEISWKKCITGKKSTNNSKFNSALRTSVSNQIKDFRNKSNVDICQECNCSLFQICSHIDHYEPQFSQLVENFLEINKEIIHSIPESYNKKPNTYELFFKDDDKWIGEAFADYHFKNASLRVLCENCNLTRKKYKKLKLDESNLQNLSLI